MSDEYLPPGVTHIDGVCYAGPFRDRAGDEKLAASFGVISIQRDICDGQRGYLVTHANGARCFHFRLNTAIPEILKALGHGEDRDVMVIGEPDVLNAW
jgi:hypothetical protein